MSVREKRVILIQGPVVMGGAKQLDPDVLKKYHDGLGFLDIMLARHTFAAGPHLTLADLVLVASIASVDVSCL